MAFRQISASILALSIAATSPAGSAAARGGDAIVGGIIGGIIGGAIANEAAKKKKGAAPVAKAAPRKAAPDPAREHRKQVQAALNYFGFNAGTPDGVYGRNTRVAIAQYQATLGYPTTGELTAFQERFLTESHLRAEAGGATTLAEIARTPGGAAGVLAAWHAEMAGPPIGGGGVVVAAPPIAPPAAGQPGVGRAAAPFLPPAPGIAGVGAGEQGRTVAPVAVGALPPAPGAGLPVVDLSAPPAVKPPAPVEASVKPMTPSLPSFLSAAPAQQASLTSHCNQVSMVTGTNGGFATLASMTDPAQALDEQFCLARTYAMTEGEALAAGVKGVTPAQLTEQCAAFGPVMAGPVALLATQGPTASIPAAAEVGAGTGLPPAQLEASAKICLSTGYRTDDMAVALGSALLLTSMGKLPYAELVGHHLMKGFGTGANQTLARDWFRIGTDAIENGQPAVFNPGQPERVTLIKALVFGEKPAPTPAPVAAGKPAPTKIPGFNTNN